MNRVHPALAFLQQKLPAAAAVGADTLCKCDLACVKLVLCVEPSVLSSCFLNRGKGKGERGKGRLSVFLVAAFVNGGK